MRKLSFWGLLIVASAAGLSASEEGKRYVPFHELEFAADGIWYNSDGLRCLNHSLHVDANGYYLNKGDESWICPHCGHRNTRPYPRYSCERCDWPYDG